MQLEFSSMENLRHAADGGDRTAMAMLAKRLLVGRDAPFVPHEGVVWLEKAAAADEPEALCTLATLRASGAWTYHSWPEALALLRRAADLGSKEAREQLLLLAGDPALAEAIRAGMVQSDNWRRLESSIDLKFWVTPGPPLQVCEIPRVWIVENFAAPALCKWLIGRSLGKFKPALMRDATTGVSQALDSRTCSDFVFDIVEGGVLLLLLRMRMSAVTSIPVTHMEPPQIFRYAVGEEIKPHHDFLFDGTRSYGRDGKYNGDRLATFLLYLNEDFDDGELEFPHAGYRYKGKTGDGIFFASQRDGKPDPMSLHAGTKVTRGEKFILSQWIHDRPFEA